MRILFFVLAFIFGISTHSSSQLKLVTVSGVVLDSATNELIPLVSIQLNSKFVGLVADEDGYFFVKGSINDTLTFERTGYHNFSHIIEKEDLHLVINLSEDAEP